MIQKLVFIVNDESDTFDIQLYMGSKLYRGLSNVFLLKSAIKHFHISHAKVSNASRVLEYLGAQTVCRRKLLSLLCYNQRADSHIVTLGVSPFPSPSRNNS